MKKKLIVFDLDGTVLDTLEDLYLSMNYALERNGFPTRTRDEIRTFVGNGVKRLVERALPLSATVEDQERVYACFTEHYTIHCADHTCAYDGIEALLTALKAHGFLLAVVSNKDDYAVRSLCNDYFHGFFELAVGAKEGTAKKPAPDMVNNVLSALGLSARDAVYIGDSEVDIETARNADMDCVSVSWGFRDRGTLLSCGASVIADTPDALLQILLKTRQK